MSRRALVLLLCVLLVDATFGLDMSLAPGLSIQNAFLYLLMVGYLIETAVYRNRKFELLSVLIPFALFIGYCILSWFVASFVIQPDYYDPLATGMALKFERFDHIVVFLLFFYGVSSTNETLSLIRIFLWMMVIGNLLTVVDGFNIPDLGIMQQREDGRVGGPMGESNQYGAFLVFILPAVVALLWDSKTKKSLAIFACFVSAVALLAASSRGAFVGLFIGSIFVVFYLRSVITMRQIAIGSTVSLAAITVLTIVFLSTDLSNELIQRLIDKSSGSTAAISSGRTAIWTAAMQRMLEYPHSFVTGFGWDAYDHMRGFRINTHNTYLNVLFNLGSIGLILYLVLVYNLFKASRNAIRKTSGTVRAHLIAFTFGFASLSVALLFLEVYRPWVYIWAYIGLIMRLSLTATQSTRTESDSSVSSRTQPGVLTSSEPG